ncbi:MAG TPA: 2OG-Fe(II) oxygenase [Candidatus Binatia bacterium]|jgi:hypothetical protein
MRLSTSDREGVLWKAGRSRLDERGFALLPALVQPETCEEIAAYYADERRFRSRVDMARYAFGRGEYKYFAYPLPKIVQQLRNSIYPELAPLANQWAERLGADRRYPERLSDFLDECHRAGQKRPTPLLLKYGAGDFNCLHQDLYGDVVFPFQLSVFLSQRGEDFAGGEFILCEQRPRQQSRAEALEPNRGDALVFSVHHRPVRGVRGYYRATLRHGVSTVHSGERYTLGIIFHDAK